MPEETKWHATRSYRQFAVPEFQFLSLLRSSLVKRVVDTHGLRPFDSAQGRLWGCILSPLRGYTILVRDRQRVRHYNSLKR